MKKSKNKSTGPDGLRRRANEKLKGNTAEKRTPLSEDNSRKLLHKYKQTEEKLRESEERLYLAMKASNLGLYDLNVKTGEARVNPQYALMLGYDPVEFHETNAKWIERLHPDERESVAAVYRAYVNGEIPEYKVECRQKTKDGNWKWILSLGSIMERDADGNPVRMLGTHTDITERKRIENNLLISEEKFRLLAEQSITGTCLIQDGKFIYVNPRLAEMLAFSQDEMIGSTVLDLVAETDREVVRENMRKRLSGEKSHMHYSFSALKKDGSGAKLEVHGSKMEYLGRPAIMATLLDITERKLAQDKLAERNQFIESIINLTPDILYIYDIVDQKNIYSNDGIQKILGYTTGEIKDMGNQVLFLLMHPDDLQTYFQKTILKYANAKNHEPITHQYRMRHKNGEWRWLYSNELIYMRESDGSPRQIFGLIHDITESKHAEEQMQRSLIEKEVMLKEIHHRVKNNMQVISSLLSLQAKGVADSTVKAMLEESRNRVSSMSLVHEKLYQSKDLAYIDFKDYLQSLVAGIANTYKRHDVVISVDMETVGIDVNVGIPCGLIVNELVSNSLKHAFPDGRKGTISLGINKNSEGNYVLFVADNGIGLPGEEDLRNTSTLGLQLVKVLTGQIHGTIEISREEGTRFSITFPGTSKK